MCRGFERSLMKRLNLGADLIVVNPHLVRRIVRSLIPAISAAASQLIFLAIAFRITSCSFIIRSTSAAEIAWFDSTPQAIAAAPASASNGTGALAA